MLYAAVRTAAEFYIKYVHSLHKTTVDDNSQRRFQTTIRKWPRKKNRT
jgi:hypothetical protein